MTHSCGRTHTRRERREPMTTQGAAGTPSWLERELPQPVADGALKTPTHDEIAALAFSYWEGRGRSGESPWEDWFRAESELKSRA